MIAFAYYLLKVIICSGILYGYYLLALRNRIFHHWNRYYLLATVLLSLLLPLISIPIVQEVKQTPNEAVRMLEIVTTGDAYVQELNNGPVLHITTEQFLVVVYILISLFFLFLMIRTLIRIRQMIRHHNIQSIEDFFFVNTAEKGTPFSFLRYIFWHEDIQPESAAGQHILKHEIAHVREKHTHDKLFLNGVLIVYWCNPFFWLIRREMAMIHEFIADKQSVDQQDTAAFAAMILQAAYPRHQFALTNNFFHSPIKRRLKMLIKSQNSRVTYITRLLALPLLLLVVAAFTLKPSRIKETPSISLPATEKSWTFIIDAGHGGEDLGVRSDDGLTEKVLTLAIAKKIKELNTNPAFNIILSRETDMLQPVREKVDFAVSQHPDAFISIHINGAPTNQPNGIEVLLGSKNTSFQKENILLGSLINQELAKVYQTLDTLKKRSEKGAWVLDAPHINYPAALVECGYLTNPKDRAFITDPINQEKIAKNILKALEKYASGSAITETRAIKGEKVTSFERKDIHRVDTEIVRIPKTSMTISSDDPSEEKRLADKLVIINGKTHTMANLINKTVEADSTVIYPMNDPTALKLYGESARNGVTVFFNAVIQETPKQIKTQHTEHTNAQGTITLKGSRLSPLYILNGVELDTLDLTIQPDDIDRIDVIKGQSAIDKYGEKGKNGVVNITTKNITSTNSKKQ
jgi:N-acetylmuramoyl-L-alanine amidase